MFSVAGIPLLAGNKKRTIVFSNAEKKAWRMQMAEMDIQVRNLSSYISLAFSVSARRSFDALTKYRVREFPDQKRAFDSAWGKFEKAKMAIYLREIRDEAERARKYLHLAQKKKKQVKWKQVELSLRKILQNCRGCHTQVKLQ